MVLTEVIVADAPHGERIVEALAALLSRHASVAVLCAQTYRRSGSAPDFLLIGSPLDHVDSRRTIVVLPPGAQRVPRLTHSVPILLCGAVADGIAPDGQLISCGLGLRDTVTISSLTPDRAVISVLRPLLTLSGASFGPMEIPVRLPVGAKIQSVLAAVTILILADRSDVERPDDGILL